MQPHPSEIETPRPDSAGRPIHSDVVWTSARDAYLAGEGGASVAARHGMAPSTFWARAAADGWRRRDRPVDAPPPFDPDRPVLDDDAQLALIDRRICWALEAGADAAALRWMRMRDRIEDRKARRLAREDRARRDVQKRAHREIGALTDAARDVERIARAGLANVETELRLHRLHKRLGARRASDGPESSESRNSGAAQSTPLDPDAPGLSRAERRRRQKYAAKHGKPPPD